tara:strand:- start:351 stop:1136 length:786 start_codon:yes stop_codon:yes gene_type:complete
MNGLTKLILWGIGGLAVGVALLLAVTPRQTGTSYIPTHDDGPDGRPYSEIPVWHKDYQTTYTQSYVSDAIEPDLDSLQCPIPMEHRVRNHTGIQCVYSSTEALGRWAEEKKLTDPPMTSRSDCKGYSGPSALASRLNKLGVRFEQSNRDRAAGLALIKKAMAEGRGCLWGVPGHAMVLCHFSEEEDRVCWFDNSDRSLKIQTTTVEKFKRRWDSWVCVIYADDDLFPDKVHGGVNTIPIRDHEGGRTDFGKKYIPMPLRND